MAYNLPRTFSNKNQWIATQNFANICPLSYKWKYVSVGLGNGLATKPMMTQFIDVNTRHYASVF